MMGWSHQKQLLQEREKTSPGRPFAPARQVAASLAPAVTTVRAPRFDRMACDRLADRCTAAAARHELTGHLPSAAHRWRKRGWSSTCNMVAAGRCRRLSAMNSPITVHPAKPDSLDMPALVGEGGRHAGQHNHPHPHGTVWKLQWRDSALSPVTRSSGHAPGDALINRLGA